MSNSLPIHTNKLAVAVPAGAWLVYTLFAFTLGIAVVLALMQMCLPLAVCSCAFAHPSK